jgi:cell division septum initiation protein DivIVA
MEIGRADYQERREAKIERLRERAASKAQEARTTGERAHKIADMIPFGQPVLCGHHSEGRHRRDIGRINSLTGKAIEASEAAQSLAARADAAEENKAISSDDPEAIARLRAKLAEVEAKRARGVEINKTIRGAAGNPAIALASLQALGIPADMAAHYLAGDCFGNKGVAPYRLANLACEARRIKQRIEEIEAKAARAPMPEEKIGEVTIQEQDNRVQLIFPGKPSDEIRARLKSNGFRWSPSAGAWQRMPSAWAWHVAREIASAVQS